MECLETNVYGGNATGDITVITHLATQIQYGSSKAT